MRKSRRATTAIRLCKLALAMVLSSRIGAWCCCEAWTASTWPAASFLLRRTSFHGDKWKFRDSSQTRRFVRPSCLHMMPEGPEVRTLVEQLRHDGAIGRRLVDIQFLSGRYVRHGRPKGFEDFAKTMMPWSQPHNAAKLSEQSVDMIRDWNAKGKFIYILLDEGSNPPEDKEDYQRSIWITLGMSGQFVNEGIHREDPRFARWNLELLDAETGRMRKIYYHDQRNFGTLRFSLSRQELEAKLASLGPDILDPFTTEKVFLDIVDRQQPQLNISKFLMDQSVRQCCGRVHFIINSSISA